MIKKVSLMIALVAIISSVSFGQIKYGVKGGLNMANMEYKQSGVSASADRLVSFEVGGFLNYSINDKISIQPELLFAQYGSKIEDLKFVENYLSIPIMAKYSIGAIGIYAGPQFGYLLSATFDGEDAMDGMKKIDMGISFGAGYEFEMGLGVDARYYLGLANIADESGYTVKNNSIQIAVSYKFK